MNRTTRIVLSDTPMDSVVKMSEGNPGCMAFLCELLKESKWGGVLGGINHILLLDRIGLYGSRAYMLWNDCCNRSIEKVELVLNNLQMGELSEQVIMDNLNQDYGTPFENLKTFEELGLESA